MSESRPASGATRNDGVKFASGASQGARCAYKNLMTGLPVCDAPAAYRAFYKDCEACGPECKGAAVCIEHGAVERTNPDLVHLIGLRLPADLACANGRHKACDGRSTFNGDPMSECPCRCHVEAPNGT